MARGRMPPSVRPRSTANRRWARMGVRGPGPHQSGVLEARWCNLVLRIPSRRPLRHTIPSVRPTERTTGPASSASWVTRVRLIPPAYVKPYVKRQKNDMADAEALCEAAQRPSMRFVPVKSEAQQANGVVFRARDLLVRQRTQCINALRGHLSQYGYVFPQGITQADTLISCVEDPDTLLPQSARAVLTVLVATYTALEAPVVAA